MARKVESKLLGILIAVAVCASGCASKSAISGAPSIPSGKADGLVEAQGLRTWYLKADGLSEGDSNLAAQLVSAEPLGTLDAWLDGRYVGSQARPSTATTVREFAIDISELEVGAHTLVLSDRDSFARIVEHEFNVSHALYVVVSNDWDTSDNEAIEYERQERLHAGHPELVLTHFVGPYTFTDPAVSETRRDWIVDWLHEQEAQFGDEIGLHVHPYCSFIESAGVTCRSEPVYAENWGRPEGYTVIVGSYTEDEFTQVLQHADDIFEQRGLGKPVTFRAGGWTAELHTLKALANAGYVADTSAVNWARLEEWKDHATAPLYPWNEEHWATITTTSQPYYPSVDDVLSSAGPNLSVLEVPDNGALVDYVTAQEMIEMFHENWPEGSALEAPTNYSIGYHPPSLSQEFYQRMDDALGHIDSFLYSKDAGPVIYARLRDMPNVNWPTAPRQ